MKRLTLGNPNTPEAYDRLWADEIGANRRQWSIPLFEALRAGISITAQVLDLGCGCSGFLTYLLNHQPKVRAVGLDFAPWALAHMRTVDPRVRWIDGDALSVPYRDGFFDVVIASDLIEHVDDPQALVREMRRLVHPGGIVRVTATTGPDDDRYHVWRIVPEELAQTLERLDMRAVFTMIGKHGVVTGIAR